MRAALIACVAAAATASAASGVWPSCAINGYNPPCPLPAAPWTPTWQLSKSTVCQPGNTAGYLNATEAAKWGLISLDWSIANQVWGPPGLPRNETTGGATLVEQCRQIKAVDPSTKCFVYRNTELALEWIETQRAAMYDPSKADYFLQYQPGNPGNVAPGTIYNENAGGPGTGCNQFFWNFSNPEAVQYVLTVSEQGPLAVDSPYVDGTFLDDVTGIPAEHGNAPRNMGISAADVTTLQNATQAFFQLAIDTLAAKGKYIWQGFGAQDGVMGGPKNSSCTSYMTRVCDAGWQSVPWTVQWDGSNTTLAAFLIGRGPVAYIGWGWNGGPLPAWQPEFDMDVGTPLSLCKQTSPGVFARAWSNGVASLDCGKWEASLPF